LNVISSQSLGLGLKISIECVHLLFGLLLLARADCASYITEAYTATQIARGSTKRQKFCQSERDRQRQETERN
jgi:hypothetical protein